MKYSLKFVMKIYEFRLMETDGQMAEEPNRYANLFAKMKSFYANKIRRVS